MPFILLEIFLVLIASVAAIYLGTTIADGGVFMSALSLVFPALLLLIVKDFSFLLWSLAIFFPFLLPLPFFVSWPPGALFVVVVLLGKILRFSLGRIASLKSVLSISPLTALFFAWVIFRYALKPVFPDPAISAQYGITGFRSYCFYGLDLLVLFSLGFFIRTPEEFKMQIRSILRVCVFFSLFFGVCVFIRYMPFLYLLAGFGIYIVPMGPVNRFVLLPGLGLILFSLALLPGIMPMRKITQWGVILLGIFAIIAGANRSSLIMLFLILMGTLFLRRKFLLGTVVVALLALLAAGAAYWGNQMTANDAQIGFSRVLGLVSPKVAAMSDDDVDVEWRFARWNRAWTDIQQHPWLGVGYGGLKEVPSSAFSSQQAYEEARVEIDLASGNIHNGYIQTAWALGIPATILFILISISEIFRSGRAAWKIGNNNPPKRDANLFVCVNLLAFQLAIFIGTDLNAFILWFFIGLSILVRHINWQDAPISRGAELS